MLFPLLLMLPWAHSYDLTNITDSVLGNRTHSIPAAFGDFNGDKLTDIFILEGDNANPATTVSVLLAMEQKVVSSLSESGPVFQGGTKQDYLQCSFPQDTIKSVVPADFDGDGGMDVLVVKESNKDTVGVILWGNHKDAGHYRLLCPEDQNSDWRKEFQLKSEPLVFDYNYDYIADLLVVNDDGARVVYRFSNNRSDPFVEEIVEANHTDPLKAQHGNAFLDLNNDGIADVLLTSVKGIELYETVQEPLGIKYHGLVPWPKEIMLHGCDVDKCVGQPVFTDFDLNGKLDLVLPMCFDQLCKNSSMYLIAIEELWTADQWQWQPMSLELEKMTFFPPDPEKGPLSAMSPRVGDIDLDGYPDLLMTLLNTVSNKPESHLLLNTACVSFTGCHPFFRQYQVRPTFSNGTGNSVMATFFDLFEDGKLDVVSVEGSHEEGYHLSAFTNTTQDSDAYFVKVIVLTGSCYHNCPNKSSSFVPYGTNSGGQMVSYRSQRMGAETFDWYQSVSIQMPQTAHFSLQLPYTIFGLGLSPNFVDYLWVNISQKTHSWPQIIPNSQLYIIPYPKDKPDEWEAKISIFPSKNILMTGLSMIGTCALTTLIIVLLHLRERRQDYAAKMQEHNRFHFDAM